MDVSSILSSLNYSNLYSTNQASEGTQPTMEEMTQNLIDEKDEDGNGTLNAAELCISEDVFNQVDTDGDGELSSEELIEGADQIREAMGPPPGMPAPPSEEDDDSDDTEKTLLDYINKDDEEGTTDSLLDMLF